MNVIDFHQAKARMASFRKAAKKKEFSSSEKDLKIQKKAVEILKSATQLLMLIKTEN